ncbi:MAG TPA: hypothetical protein VFF33_06730 [Ignavibacteriaceae bacterium]|nr:hypothetical protein [Ignavibacteriaceae bacterium]
MKAFFLFLSILFSFTFSFSQEEQTKAFELAIVIKNNTFGDQIVVEMDLVSVCWNAILFNKNKHDITDLYPGTIIIPTERQSTVGWNVPWRVSPDNFGLGKYLVTVSRGTLSDHFYIDYRTSDMPENYKGEYDLEFFF